MTAPPEWTEESALDRWLSDLERSSVPSRGGPFENRPPRDNLIIKKNNVVMSHITNHTVNLHTTIPSLTAVNYGERQA